jgi:cell filamentation protein
VSDRDPYAYPGSDVLRNKPGFRDVRQLQEFEYRRTAERSLELAEQPVQGRFDLAHLQAIHKRLFQDVYEWAGQLRTVGITKEASTFAMPEQIEGYSKQVFGAIAKDKHLQGLDKADFVDRLAHHFSEINAVHPFREGNGRASREFIAQLARQAGYELDYSKTNAKAWNEASRASFAGNLALVKEVFREIAAPTRAVAFEHDAPADALNRHPELKGAFMTMKAAEGYAAERIADPAAQAAFLAKTRQSIMDTLARGEHVPEPATKAVAKPDRER